VHAPVEQPVAPGPSDEIQAAEAARKLKEESAKAVAAKLVAEKVAAAEAAAARLETESFMRRMDPLAAAGRPASAPVPVPSKGASRPMMLAAAAVAFVVAGLGVTQGAAWFGLNPAPAAEATQPAQVQVADMKNMTPTPVRRTPPPAPSAEPKPAVKEPRVAPVAAKPVTVSKPKPKPEAPVPSAAPLSSPTLAIRQEAPQALPEAPRAVATVASAPAGKLFERNEVDDAPQIVTRVEPKLPAGDKPTNDLVIVRVLVSQSGHPYRVSLLRGSKKGRQLDDAVVEAVNQWTFSLRRSGAKP
jgi:outer membrane biosynthesis protein TonB